MALRRPSDERMKNALGDSSLHVRIVQNPHGVWNTGYYAREANSRWRWEVYGEEAWNDFALKDGGWLVRGEPIKVGYAKTRFTAKWAAKNEAKKIAKQIRILTKKPKDTVFSVPIRKKTNYVFKG